MSETKALTEERIGEIVADLKAGRLRGVTLNRVEHKDGLVYLWVGDQLLVCTTEEAYQQYIPN